MWVNISCKFMLFIVYFLCFNIVMLCCITMFFVSLCNDAMQQNTTKYNTSSWLKLHLSLVPLYWNVVMWEIWGNPFKGHIWWTLFYCPMKIVIGRLQKIVKNVITCIYHIIKYSWQRGTTQWCNFDQIDNKWIYIYCINCFYL